MDQIQSWDITQLKSFLDEHGLEHTNATDTNILRELVASVIDPEYIPMECVGSSFSSSLGSPSFSESSRTQANTQSTMDHDDAIVQFVSFTDCDLDVAPQFLQMADWDVQRAVQLYQARNQPSEQTPTDNEAISSSNQQSGEEQQVHDGIRVPDAIVRQQLLTQPHRYVGKYGPRTQAEDPRVEWLFQPPRDLSSQQAFDAARQMALAKDKWLLVNIQDHQKFESHKLNRDVWTNDAVIDVIGARFIFWQRGHTCEDGQEFLRRYKLSEDDLPYIGAIHPRTGAAILQASCELDAGNVASFLMEFIEDNSLTGTAAPKFRHIRKNRTLSETEKDDDDDEEEEEEELVLPEEPAEDAPNSTRVQIKLEGGATIVRRFNLSDKVDYLFLLVTLNAPEAATRKFELMTKFPRKNLSEYRNMTIAEADLQNVSCSMRWLS